jgi:hypothetical protein
VKAKTINLLWLVALVATGFVNSTGHGQTKPAIPALPRVESVFVIPSSIKDGRDPFFPESTRTFENKVVASTVFEITSLKYMGLSGTQGHLFAIINNHTFTVGDDGDVMTTSGRVHLRCVEINANEVLVEINGQIHRIKLEDQ